MRNLHEDRWCHSSQKRGDNRKGPALLAALRSPGAEVRYVNPPLSLMASDCGEPLSERGCIRSPVEVSQAQPRARGQDAED